MAKYILNLSSTFKEFINALNTNTEDTEGIIQGTKKVKKLVLGEDDEKGSLEYQIEDNVTDVLLKGQSVTLQCNPHEQGWGSKIVCDRGSLKLFADDDIEIRADKGAYTRFYNDITFREANIVGEIDFSNATVTGLNLGGSGGSSGGTLPIEVDELPTENIDDSKIYVLSVIENKEVYYHFEVGYFTLKDLVATTQGIQADITYYVVKELPTSPLTSNLATFSTVHCYIYNDIAYVYGNAGYGNMWLTVSTLVSQISGATVTDKGRTPNIATENNDIAMYVYYEDYKKFYLYSNEQWVQITDSKSNTYILSLSGTNGTLTDEQYQAIKDNFPNVIVLYTEQESNATGTLVMPITGTVNGLYIATYTANTAVSNITIYANKSWDFQEYNFKNVYVTMDSAQSIGGDKTFNGKATFNGEVDFSNATVTGLLSAGGITELTTQSVRITDLEDGIYKWVYDGEKTLYYYGETDTTARHTLSIGSQLLIVYGTRETDSTSYPYYKNWILFGEPPSSGTNMVSQSIKYGCTSKSLGTSNDRYFTYVPTSPAMTLSGAQTVSGNKTFSGTNAFTGSVDFTNANVTGLPSGGSGSIDTSNLVTLDTEQTISGKKTFSGIKIGNANIEWEESGFKELDIKIDEGNGALVFRADDVSLLSNNDIMIERGGLSAVNVSSSGIYIYDENVDTGNCANINFEDGIISLSSDNKIDFTGKVDFSNANVTGLPASGLTQEQVQEMINTAINGALEGDY